MNKIITRLAFISLLSVLIAGAPVRVFAEDKSDKKEHAGEKKKGKPFKGKVDAVDKTAKTIKVGERTFQITSDTKIVKAGKPATFDDAVVGEEIGGTYHKTDDGKMVAVSIRLGAKPEGEAASKKKKEAPTK